MGHGLSIKSFKSLDYFFLIIYDYMLKPQKWMHKYTHKNGTLGI